MAFPTPVQTATAVLTDAGGATTTISFASLPTAGNSVVVYYTDTGGANPTLDPTMADNQGVGNSYVKAISGVDSAAGQMAAIFRCDIIGATSGTFTVTVTHNAASNNYSLIGMQEIPGRITLDQTASNQAGATTTNTVTTAALTSSSELACSCFTVNNSSANNSIACSGFTNAMVENNASIHISGSGDYQVETTSSAVSAAYSFVLATTSVAVIATFKAYVAPGAISTAPSLLGSRRNRPGRGPYSFGKYNRPTSLNVPYVAPSVVGGFLTRNYWWNNY